MVGNIINEVVFGRVVILPRKLSGYSVAVLSPRP